MDYDNRQASAQRATMTDASSRQQSSMPDSLPLLRIAALEEEAARLRQSVAELREANEHLVLATVNAETLREDAVAANRRQNEFLAMLAHELRNPLAPLAMAASLLERTSQATPQLLDMARVIGRQVGHMAHLLDDLLDAARISSGKITLAVEPLALAEVLQGAVETTEPRMQQRAQRLTLALPETGPVVDGDRVRLTQVFTNLLNNASKYTGDGGHVRVSVEDEPQLVRVIIEDNGTGMAPDVIPHIFDLFTQGPRTLARSEGGLGVGLNVVRNLVGMHRGSVVAESPGLGKGSRFTVVLPRSSSQPAIQASPAPSGSAARRSILLIEDNPDACAMLAELLRSEGHDVVCAGDGRAGLTAALGRAFDVVLCDIGLPGLDGLDVIRALRAAAGGERPLAIALTGYGQAEDHARGLEAGFDAYLVKPIDPARLFALLASERVSSS